MDGRESVFDENTLSFWRAKPVACGSFKESWAGPAPFPLSIPLEVVGSLELQA